MVSPLDRGLVNACLIAGQPQFMEQGTHLSAIGLLCSCVTFMANLIKCEFVEWQLNQRRMQCLCDEISKARQGTKFRVFV